MNVPLELSWHGLEKVAALFCEAIVMRTLTRTYVRRQLELKTEKKKKYFEGTQNNTHQFFLLCTCSNRAWYIYTWYGYRIKQHATRMWLEHERRISFGCCGGRRRRSLFAPAPAPPLKIISYTTAKLSQHLIPSKSCPRKKLVGFQRRGSTVRSCLRPRKKPCRELRVSLCLSNSTSTNR